MIRLTPDIANSNNRITQQAVRKGTRINPIWLLSASESSYYLIEVRRWPREVGAAMTQGIPASSDPNIEYIGHADYSVDVEGVPLDISAVELHLSDREVLKKEVRGNEQNVEFEVHIPEGDIDLEAWFVLADGTKQGAYFVYIDQI
jgi:hypothetical protein